jgi:prolyl-tRNA synthetase
MVPAAQGEDLVLVCKKCSQAKAFNADSLLCSKCNFKMDKVNAIEVGHIFKLGIKYSQALQANFSDAKGTLKPIIMGCYGIGVSRLVSAIIEQNNDAEGIIWPKEVTPYQILVLPLDVTNSQIMQKAIALHDQLSGLGFEVLLDDRDERAGVKFKDADLLGIPLQVIVGKESLKNNLLELKNRRTQEKLFEQAAGVLAKINDFYHG